MKFQEGDIEFDFSKATSAIKFDDNSHKLAHAMKAVDFVVYTERLIYLIEIKDPQHPKATDEQFQKFIDDLKAQRLMDILKYKFRDSFLYLYGNKAVTKDIFYLVLICVDTLAAAELLNQTEALKRNLPLLGPDSKPWKQPFVSGCAVLNLDMWNRHTLFPARRVGNKS